MTPTDALATALDAVGACCGSHVHHSPATVLAALPDDAAVVTVDSLAELIASHVFVMPDDDDWARRYAERIIQAAKDAERE